MEFVNLFMYSVFFLTAMMLVIFNVLYSLRIHSADYKMGFGIPRIIKRALEINTLIALLAMVVLAFVLVNAIATIRIPSIL